ncbi:monovalent cation/H+ antiporter subunit E [Halorubrum sp. Atlit-8R]|uniref:monovalent cation/H+ antiporter subunit E n=1 Tax=unclassified Halorubrum TaxID=2642239 RepID=UPI000EF23DDC|nr:MULTISPECIES: monovalent cation/H+ antiporter subunit E [unclassified Halorubrum]RLM70984.1 monovalent cation/H+ antiporter subunit E [Halorubrum sp. Atlit-9R]RLM71852.1 monovalent cation/H+ antiporter subunit E [Halorubrum sp. Atlit-9R]RLM82863.1 monovalent cation/H+ antiporter subunit E [Halorubrum sp. Atlit-8R]
MADGGPPTGQVTDGDAPADAAATAADAAAESASAGAVIVPVEPSSTLRSTVAHVAEAAAADGASAIHFVEIASWRNGDPESDERAAAAERVLERVTSWATADLDDSEAEAASEVEVVSAVLGADDYLFGADDYVRVLAEYAEANGADRVVLDPEYTPVGNTTLLQPLEFALSNTPLSVETAPVDRPTRRERFRTEATTGRFVALFGLSLAFYLLLGDPTYWFDLVTGVATAAVVSITLSRVSLDSNPAIPRTPMRIVRGVIYVPVLLLEIVKANLVVARVILDPRLPIDPTLNRMRVIVGSGLPLMTLANSITLTPGTLTVRARDSDLYVHSLLPWAREGLFDGSLERWTRFVYYGRRSARLPTPRERDDVAILQGDEATEELPIAAADGGAVEATDASGEGEPTPDASDADEVTDR